MDVNQDQSSQTDPIDALTRRLQRYCALRFAPTMKSAFSSKGIDAVTGATAKRASFKGH